MERPGDKNPAAEGKQPIEKFLIKRPNQPPPTSSEADNKKPWSSVPCPHCDMIFYKRSAMEV